MTRIFFVIPPCLAFRAFFYRFYSFFAHFDFFFTFLSISLLPFFIFSPVTTFSLTVPPLWHFLTFIFYPLSFSIIFSATSLFLSPSLSFSLSFSRGFSIVPSSCIGIPLSLVHSNVNHHLFSFDHQFHYIPSI